MRPRFVSVKLLKDGIAELIDDDGDRYHVQMDRDLAWPILSRVMRAREMRESMEERRKAEREVREPQPPIGPFVPKIVG